MTKKHIFRFILFTCFSLLLLFLWVFPFTGAYFDKLDNAAYYFLNSTLENGKNWQLFWAITNVRVFDLAGGIFVLLMLFFHMYSKNNLKNNPKPMEIFITFAVFMIISIIVNKIAFSGILGLLKYHRPSPSLTLEGGIRLSEIITSFEFKDASKDCFPGDHAAVLLCSTIYFFIYGNKKLGFLSCFLLLPFILPRLVVGAHWFTDCLVGSTFIMINSFNIWINVPVIKENVPKGIFKKYNQI
ncbi:MAG: phosphatase PAP2 family protein, partial [Desulfobacteraceae bacterium]|nr:phosphatase PAP2 family protein [Desulfobacteraceae bacterium]